MREMTPDEVLSQLRVSSGGTDEERAAAMAVLAAAISDSQKLGKLVISQGSSDWSSPLLRGGLGGADNQSLRRPIN